MKQLTAKLVLGTVQFGIPYGINNTSGLPSEETVFRLFDTAYENGIRSLDTADAYGTAIDIIGAYHRQTSNRFAVNNKFSGGDDTAEHFFDKISSQLALLQLPFFEHYLFHKAGDIRDKRYAGVMVALKGKGYAKYIGVSVYTNEQFSNAVEFDFIDSIQVPFNLLDNSNKRGALLELAERNNKKVHARSVFLQGLFFTDNAKLPVKLAPLSVHLKKIKEVAVENAIPVNALALHYVLQNSKIDKVLIGVDNEAHLKEALQAIEVHVDQNVFDVIDDINVQEVELLNPMNW